MTGTPTRKNQPMKETITAGVCTLTYPDLKYPVRLPISSGNQIIISGNKSTAELFTPCKPAALKAKTAKPIATKRLNIFPMVTCIGKS